MSQSLLAFRNSSVQFSSIAQSCLTLCDPMNCNMPGLPVHHQLLEFTQTHEHIGYLPTWGVPLSVSYHFVFSYCSWGSQGKNTEVVCHSLLQWTTFGQTSPWPIHLGWPHMAWLSFIELDKAVVRVIRLTSFLWLWFVCLPSDASLNLETLTYPKRWNSAGLLERLSKPLSIKQC